MSRPMTRILAAVVVLSLLTGYHLTLRLTALEGQIAALQAKVESLEMERQPLFKRAAEVDRTYTEWYEAEVEEEVVSNP